MSSALGVPPGHPCAQPGCFSRPIQGFSSSRTPLTHPEGPSTVTSLGLVTACLDPSFPLLVTSTLSTRSHKSGGNCDVQGSCYWSAQKRYLNGSLRHGRHVLLPFWPRRNTRGVLGSLLHASSEQSHLSSCWPVPRDLLLRSWRGRLRPCHAQAGAEGGNPVEDSTASPAESRQTSGGANDEVKSSSSLFDQSQRESMPGQTEAGGPQKSSSPPVPDSSSQEPRPRKPRNRPAQQDENEGWRRLLPDLGGVLYVCLHLAALILTSKLTGLDVLAASLVRRVPTIKVVPSAAAAAGSRVAGRPAGVSNSNTPPFSIVVEKEGAVRKPAKVKTSLAVPFSEFLYHVKKDNLRSVTVDGDKVTFVVRRLDAIQSEHRAAVMLPEVLTVQTIIQEDPKLRAQLGDPADKDKKGKLPPFLLEMQLCTVRPSDLSLPYTELSAKGVQFGSLEKAPFNLVNNISMALLYAGVLASIASRLSIRVPNKLGGRHKNKKGQGPGVMFADVAGVDEAKEELEEIVEYLRLPEKFTRLGARPPRGVLLVGPPGTGKTMLAKAVAGEADVPFISCSGSEFVELYVGLGASRVRDLFSQAKREAPSIVFIDEIDSVAKVRDGRARSVGNDEREQTLNQLLTEMDGFDSNTAVIVLAATNRADVLDPALRRPGRFDRIVAVEPPDRKGRVDILEVHLEKQQLPLAEDFDIKHIATATSGFTGADLANLVNEAALLAARDDGCNEVAAKHFDKAVERAIAGIEKKRSALGRSEKGVVARHEVGHAIAGAAVAHVLGSQSIVQKISIVPRSGGALGFAYIPPSADGDERQLLFVDEMRGQLVTLLGGRAAEEVSFSGRVSTGAMDDIRRATDLAYKAIAEYGLSSTIGPLSVATLSGGGLEGAASLYGFPSSADQGRLGEMVEREVQSLLLEALEVARNVVQRNERVLSGLGQQLQEDEAVEGTELQTWLNKVVETDKLKLFLTSASLTYTQQPNASDEPSP